MSELEPIEIDAISGAGFWKDVGAYLAQLAADRTCDQVPDEVYNRARAHL